MNKKTAPGNCLISQGLWMRVASERRTSQWLYIQTMDASYVYRPLVDVKNYFHKMNALQNYCNIQKKAPGIMPGALERRCKRQN
jgi:hypothetical protein